MRKNNFILSRINHPVFLGVLLVAFFLCIPSISRSEVLESSNFKVLDPVVNIGADRASSSNFILLQSLGETALGTSSSASNFKIISGFLPFPTVTLPVPTATAGDGQVSLSWSAATGFLGWTVSGYNVAYGTVSGGPYTYTTVGNVTSASVTGLSNSTTYYFRVRPQDFFGNSVGTSTEVSATPVAGATPAPTPTGGGGGPPGLITVPYIPLVIPEIIPPEIKRKECLARADFNADKAIDIVDLSIFLFHYDVSDAPGQFDLDKNKKIDVVDVSILFYCWGVKDAPL